MKANKIHGTIKSPRRSLRHSLPSLHGLLLFEASSRHLNFSKAAEELAITQSAISHGVKQLEEGLGHPLFLRESRALILTSQGQRLYASLSRGFAPIAETVDDISASDQKDKLVVGCSTMLAIEWLLPRLPSLRVSHPDLRIEVRSAVLQRRGPCRQSGKDRCRRGRCIRPPHAARDGIPPARRCDCLWRGQFCGRFRGPSAATPCSRHA